MINFSKTKFIATIMTSVICFTIIQAMDLNHSSQDQVIQQCREGMVRYFGNLDITPIDCAKHIVKHMLRAEISATEDPQIIEYINKFNGKNFLICTDNIPSPMDFCIEKASKIDSSNKEDKGEDFNEGVRFDEINRTNQYLNCILQLENLLGIEKYCILNEVLYNHKQGTWESYNTDAGIHPPGSYMFKYLHEVAEKLKVFEELVSPRIFCNSLKPINHKIS